MPNNPPAAMLESDFFARSTVTVARQLLGKYLIRRDGKTEAAVMIHETEAYVGPHDKACHASRGHTPRTAPMFGPPGYWYVYFVYGMHWMLNIVTADEGYPAAVLLRGAGAWAGPAKLTKALAIDKAFNGLAADRDTNLWIEDRGVRVAPRHVKKTPRIGVAYAGAWANKPYRFLLNQNATGRKDT